VATILILTPRKWRAQYRASPILHGSMPMNINVIIIVVASLHNAWDLNVFICSAGTCLILISLTYHLPTCCYVMCLLSLSSCVFGGHCFQCLGIVLLDRCYVMWYFTSTNDTLFKLKWQISRFTNACFSVTVMLIESSLQTVDTKCFYVTGKYRQGDEDSIAQRPTAVCCDFAAAVQHILGQHWLTSHASIHQHLFIPWVSPTRLIEYRRVLSYEP